MRRFLINSLQVFMFLCALILGVFLGIQALRFMVLIFSFSIVLGFIVSLMLVSLFFGFLLTMEDF